MFGPAEGLRLPILLIQRGAIPLALVLVALFSPMSAAPAEAATITVTTGTDEARPNNGRVSLREAITAINAASDGGDNDVFAHRSGSYGSGDTIIFGIPGNFFDQCLKTIPVGADSSAAGLQSRSARSAHARTAAGSVAA